MMQEEFELAGEEAGYLFVVMMVQGNVSTFAEGDAGDHDVDAGDELAAEEWVHELDGEVGPAGVCVGHWVSVELEKSGSFALLRMTNLSGSRCSYQVSEGVGCVPV